MARRTKLLRWHSHRRSSRLLEAVSPLTKRNRNSKSRTRKQKPKRGGRIGKNKVDMYLIAYPQNLKHDRVMYYTQHTHEDGNDLTNVDFIEDLIETMIKSDPPLVAYKKTMTMKEKKD